jgi:hypothetical protein
MSAERESNVIDTYFNPSSNIVQVIQQRSRYLINSYVTHWGFDMKSFILQYSLHLPHLASFYLLC